MHVTVKLLLQVVALSEETVLEPLLVVPKYVVCPLMPGDIDWYRLHFQFLYTLLYKCDPVMFLVKLQDICTFIKY